MTFKMILAGAALSTVLALGAVQAEAATLQFVVTGADSYSWLQDSAPTPINSMDGVGTTVPVWNASHGDFTEVFFLNGPENFGGVAVNGLFGGYVGPQAYSGSESAPIFAPTLIPIAYAISFSNAPDYLTITAVPEPSAWLLMIAGMATLGSALRLSRSRAALAA
jgi:hypothetical protein